jgi:predicted nucleic acid-binding protein
MNTNEWPCRIKSARRKRRLVKTDRDKQLIQLDKRRTELGQQKKLLPLMPLKVPYQRGWKRFFVLHDDLKRSPMAAFYETLLVKINTIEYHYDKSFKRKKRRKKRYGFEMRQQMLREFYPYSWQTNRINLTDDEKACFTRVETFDVKTRRIDVKYVFTESWHYVLKVMPNIITHTKLMDADIERELSYIDDHIDNNHFAPRINLLTRGRNYRWKNRFNERIKYINKLKNIPRYAYKEAYLELET